MKKLENPMIGKPSLKNIEQMNKEFGMKKSENPMIGNPSLKNIEQMNKEFRMKKLENPMIGKPSEESGFPTSSFEIPCLPAELLCFIWPIM